MVSFYSAIVKFGVSLGLYLQKRVPSLGYHYAWNHLGGRQKDVYTDQGPYRKGPRPEFHYPFPEGIALVCKQGSKKKDGPMMTTIRRARKRAGDIRPIIFLILDDTGCWKDISTRKMEGLDFHFSNTEGKSVWSHCLVTTYIVSEGYSVALGLPSILQEGTL
ncbi:hypothetical protein [Bacillus sp. FJAT-27445]|uniref:hypothetical protein n=1 Tax=Bacillus sp. FJAT-27445 TaxID=1679166 RepID=UPI0007442563|nr:hypothetical protein [Bacillus sp. FJAT-27445]